MNSDLLVANRILGPKQAGYLAVVLQLTAMVRMLVDLTGSILSPVAVAYASRDDVGGLRDFTLRSTKYLGLVIALPAGVLAGAAGSLLPVWLGAEFDGLAGLVAVAMLGLVVTLPLTSLGSVFLATNTVGASSLANLSMGVIQVALGLLLSSLTPLRLYGIVIAGIIAMGARNTFLALRARTLLRCRGRTLMGAQSPGIAAAAIAALGARIVLELWPNPGSIAAIVACAIGGAAWGIVTFISIVSHRGDKGFLVAFLPHRMRGRMGTTAMSGEA